MDQEKGFEHDCSRFTAEDHEEFAGKQPPPYFAHKTMAERERHLDLRFRCPRDYWTSERILTSMPKCWHADGSTRKTATGFAAEKLATGGVPTTEILESWLQEWSDKVATTFRAGSAPMLDELRRRAGTPLVEWLELRGTKKERNQATEVVAETTPMPST